MAHTPSTMLLVRCVLPSGLTVIGNTGCSNPTTEELVAAIRWAMVAVESSGATVADMGGAAWDCVPVRVTCADHGLPLVGDRCAVCDD